MYTEYEISLKTNKQRSSNYLQISFSKILLVSVKLVCCFSVSVLDLLLNTRFISMLNLDLYVCYFDAQEHWGEVYGSFYNLETDNRGLKLLDFATYNIVLANTLGTVGSHKPSRRWTWHSPDGTHQNQIDYILVKKRFRSDIKTARTRTFPGADVGSGHGMVMTFQTYFKNSRKPTQPRIRFGLEKLNSNECFPSNYRW